MVSVIYVIGESPTGKVKIGVSDEPWKRLKGIQTGNPGTLGILATFPGDRGTEKHIHNAFRDYRLSGEWFDLNGRNVVDEVSLLLGCDARAVTDLNLRDVERRRLLRTKPEVDERRRFSMLFNEPLARLAQDRAMPRSEIVTLLILVSWANDEGVAVATLDQIAEHLDYGRGHVAEALQALIARGLLVKLKRCVYRIPLHVLLPANPMAREIPA